MGSDQKARFFYYLQKITIIFFIYFHELNGQNSQS